MPSSFNNTSRTSIRLVSILLVALLHSQFGWRPSTAFFVGPPPTSPALCRSTNTATTTTTWAATTVAEPETKEALDIDDATTSDDETEYPDLEYLQDMQVSRELDDPFHILLLDSTFEKPKITVPYVSASLQYVLNMPSSEATELSKACKDNGLSCLGTWSREECLSLGRALQVRDLVTRVVPYTDGGQRGWQAKDANSSNGEKKNVPSL